MKRDMKKAMQVIALAVLVAGGSLLIAGSEEVLNAGSEEMSEESASNACYYGYDCRCDEQRRDSIEVAKRKRNKDFSGCTNPFCFEQVNREYRARLVEIEANYQLCLSWCYIGSWP